MEKINLNTSEEIVNNPEIALESNIIPSQQEEDIGESTSKLQASKDAERLEKVRDELSRNETPKVGVEENGGNVATRESEATTSSIKIKKSSKLASWFKKTLGIGSAVAMGYFGSQELNAGESTNTVGKSGMESGRSGGTNLVEKRDFKGYGIDVSNTIEVSKDGKVVKVLKSVDNKTVSGDVKVVKEGSSVGEKKTRIEKRNFSGYGINVVNTVEVDEDGNIIRTIKSENR